MKEELIETAVTNIQVKPERTTIAETWRAYGLDPTRLLGIPADQATPLRVLPNGTLAIKTYVGEKAKIYLMLGNEGKIFVTALYKKTGKKLRANLDVISQPGWRTLDQTLIAAAKHGYLRLRSDEPSMVKKAVEVETGNGEEKKTVIEAA